MAEPYVPHPRVVELLIAAVGEHLVSGRSDCAIQIISDADDSIPGQYRRVLIDLLGQDTLPGSEAAALLIALRKLVTAINNDGPNVDTDDYEEGLQRALRDATAVLRRVEDRIVIQCPISGDPAPSCAPEVLRMLCCEDNQSAAATLSSAVSGGGTALASSAAGHKQWECKYCALGEEEHPCVVAWQRDDLPPTECPHGNGRHCDWKLMAVSTSLAGCLRVAKNARPATEDNRWEFEGDRQS